MKEKLAEWLVTIFGFRKLITWLCLFIIAVIFRLDNYIDGAQFVDLMKNTFLAFVAANSTEHFLITAKEYFKGQNKNQDEEVVLTETEGK